MEIYSSPQKKYTYYDFDNVKLPSASTQEFEVSVVAETTLACSSKWGNCKIRYHEEYTPMLHDTIPNQLTYGMTINFILNPNRCHNAVGTGQDPFYYLKIGDTLTDWEGLIDSGTRLPDWQEAPVTTIVGKNKPAKSVDPDISFMKYGKVNIKETARHCTFNGLECWTVRVHPKIDKISAASGYLLGGQTLKIEGWGLKGLTSTTVTTDGVPCKIDTARSTEEVLYCETGSKAVASTTGPRPGQPGITYNFVNPTNPDVTPEFTNSLDATYPKTTKLATSLETLYNTGDHRAVHNYDGWFKAPESGQYRFYMQGDDQLKLWLDSTNAYDASTPVTTTLVEIGQQYWNKSWRQYYHVEPLEGQGKFVTDLITLEGGKYYKLRAQHRDTGGGMFATFSMEFMKPGSENHPMAAKQVQSWRIDQSNVAEQWTLTVNNPGTGKYKLSMKSPKETTSWLSDEIACNASAGTFRDRIWNFFADSKRASSHITVTLAMFDADGVATTNSALAKKYVYTTKVIRRISGYSFTTATALPIGTISSTIEIVKPSDTALGGIQSSAPLSGKFTIQCKDKNDVLHTSQIMNYDQWDEGIRVTFFNTPYLRGKVRVYAPNGGPESRAWPYYYSENGKHFIAIFDGFNENVPKCDIVSDTTNPLTGADVVVSSEIIRPYGQSLMFEPVGLEFLYSDAQSPQVLVDVDGLPALCVNLNCDYSYIAATSEITLQSYDQNTKVVVVNGTSLPTTGLTLSFGGATCLDSTPSSAFTETQITCTLKNAPRAGDHKVEIRDSKGLIPFAAGVADINIPLVITSVTPNIANALGGDILTIVGTGFPLDINIVKVALKSSDGQNRSPCKVLTSTETQITCFLEKMTTNDGSIRSIEVNVENPRYINRRRELFSVVPTSQTASSPLNQKTGLPVVQSILQNKTNVSPILKQELTFQLSAAEFTDALLVSQLSVQLINEAKNYSRDLYVMRVDDAAKTFTVKFNGAPPAQYVFAVTANTPSKYGRLDSSAIQFQTSSTVTDVQPKSGSVYGGTLLTITGTNFSTEKLDQAVKVGENYCDILTATTTQLTCRIRATGYTADKVATGIDVVVTLAASFEATCVGDQTCKFEFKVPAATVTSLTPGFDAATNTLKVTLAGSGFTVADTTSVSLFIDGVQQTTLSVGSEVEAIFTVTDVKDVSSTNVQVYFADGNPTDYTKTTSLTFTPSFVSVSPNTGGSIGGTLVTVTGTGFGINTKDLGLKKGTSAFCQEVKVTGYGKFTCLTKSVSSLSTDVLKFTILTTEYACANTDQTLCSLSQESATSPKIDTVALSGNTLTFTGTLFPSKDTHSAKAVFKSQSVVVTDWTETGLVATFTKGVPATKSGDTDLPTIWFTRNSDSVILITNVNGLTFTNTVSVTNTDSSSGVQSSFAGGVSYTVTKDNVFATLKEAGNGMTVCGNPASLDEASSDASKAVFKVPALATTYSATSFKIAGSGLLKGTWTGSAQTEVTKVTDGKWPTEYTDAAANCWIKLDFPTGQVGVLDNIKILINNLKNDKTPFASVSKVQGYDGTTWVDILTLDATINEGWNTFSFSSEKPAYSSYKLSGATAGSCRFGEIKFIGTQTVKDTNTSFSCTPKLTIGASSIDLSPISYEAAKTATITKITPRYGAVQGGEQITITGTNFVDGQTTVTIDNIACAIVSVTTSQIVCTTGPRPGDQPNPSFVVQVAGQGLAANQGNSFMYVSYWSNPITWGGDAPPQFGEAISIPKGRSLLVDVDKVPQLSFILVEGALLFAPHPTDATHERRFDAGYIFINGGYMEVGTEQFPYTSKITITMHGDVTTPAIPTYGNKNIAVRKGSLHLVGKTREITWTMLDSTAPALQNKITLLSQPDSFDWAVGEQIVIASTDYDHEHSETRFITAVEIDPRDASLAANVKKRRILTLDKDLVYKHYAKREEYGTSGDFIEMRAEVGLLTRNVKYQGDPETSPKNQYGAHIMIHYPEDESCVGRILYTEFFNVGQAFKLGRYPIHFHVIGTVSKSLVKGNAIHQTYNRAVTIHAVSYFTIENNVIYNAMGHNIFIEDAIETKNVIKNNLVVSTRRSWSLLNTDQTPASFWITHPDNIFIGNHAAGSDRYGYWFDTQENPINGSFTPTICPVHEKLGEFRDNETHSNGRYGLRLFHKLIPRTRGCDPWIFDNSNPAAVGSPYPANPAIPAKFYNLVSWKNLRAGAIAEEMGAVEWHNFKVADNIQAGMEWSFADDQVLDKDIMMIKGGLVVGSTENSEPEHLDGGGARGIVGPRWDYLTIRDTKFYNLNFGSSGALGDCSHCFHPAATDSGARTIFTSGLYFDEVTVPKRIWYQYPWNGIYEDLDGTLTGFTNGEGANSFATANWLHNEQPECTKNLAKYDGIICKNTVQVRRISFHMGAPASLRVMPLKIAKYDDSVMAALSAADKTTYVSTNSNYSAYPYKEKLSPMNSWTTPYVTGHKYRIYFDVGQLNWQLLKIEVSRIWQPTDKPVLFNNPYTENYEAMDFFGKYGGTFAADGTGALYYPNGSLTTTLQANWKSGMNSLDTTKKEFDFVINGSLSSSKNLEMQSVKCRQNEAVWCVTAPTITTSCTGTVQLWSDPEAWKTVANPTGTLPKDGENVEIPTGKNIVFNLGESPKFKLVKVTGCLSFLTDNSKDQTFHAEQIFVFGGKLMLGTDTAPYTKKANIVLYGTYNDSFITMPGATEAGNKMIANVGSVKIYGAPRSRMSRLLAEVQKGATSCTVQKDLDWVAGDQLGFAPSATQNDHFEIATIQSYTKTTGALVLTAALKYYHFGAAESTGANNNYQGLDMRGEVVLLTRNIVIKGDQTGNDWHGQFLTFDSTVLDSAGKPTEYKGQTVLKNVEFYKMGQLNNFKAAIRFENSNQADDSTTKSEIENVAIHESVGWGVNINLSSNISLKNVDVFDVTQIGVSFDQTTSVSADSVNVFGVRQRELVILDKITDRECCFAMCTYTKDAKCFKTSVTNSIVAGCPFAGFLAPGYSCNDTIGESKSSVFKNNVAHSVAGQGIVIFPDLALADSKTCYQGSHLFAYKNQHTGVGVLQTTNEIRFSNIVSVDNTLGISLNVAGETDTEKIVLFQDSFIYGETNDLAKDCPDKFFGNTGANCICKDKMGHMTVQSVRGGKDDPHIPMASPRPVYKIKSYATWNSKAVIKNVNFINFKSEKTACGAAQSVFGVNFSAADLIPMHYFNGAKFTNVKQDALIFVYDPPAGWANIDDCGQWPCTAPSNLVYTFQDSVFEVPDATTALPTFWNAGTTTKYNFQVVSDFETAAKSYPNCTKNEIWNAWICADPAQVAVPQIGTLLFESLDGDTEDRAVQPVIITNDATGYKNVLNAFMDHKWDGFYTGQIRLSRFPAQILTGQSYTLTYSGTPFKNARYVLKADPLAKGILIKIPYPNAGAYSVKVNGKIIEPQKFDSVTQKIQEIDVKTATCGANLFVGVVNYLQFFITPGCNLNVIPRDAIMTSVRLAWTATEFFSGDGATTFTQRLASVLGIDITRVKIVSVFEGSLNVQVQILDDPTKQVTSTTTAAVTSAPESVTQLAQLTTVLVQKLSTASAEVLGAPVLELKAAIQQTAAPVAGANDTNVTPTTPVVIPEISLNNVPTYVTPTVVQIGGAIAKMAFSVASMAAILLATLV